MDTPLKNKAYKEFRLFRIKIFFGTLAMLIAAALSIYILYSFFLRGNFAVLMVSLFENVFGMDSKSSLALYQRTFRTHMDTFIWLSMLLAFTVLFSVYLRWFTRYFEEISRGMDVLLRDTPGEISLSPELLTIERKMNLTKHTIDQQKSRMLLDEQQKNDLIMYLAHDLKTPLASSISYLSLLRDEKQISDELREKYLSISISKAERLEDLINEFLEIAKYNLSSITLQYREINLTRLLEQLVYEFGPVLDKKDLSCRLEMKEDITLKCDADKMLRVFDNLLQNAAVYSSKGSNITIEARCHADHVTITFSNHGSTIPKEKLDRIFQQFYRLDGEHRTEGTGLGLAIAKQITELHGGTITAASEHDETVFTVMLPILRNSLEN